MKAGDLYELYVCHFHVRLNYLLLVSLCDREREVLGAVAETQWVTDVIESLH